MSLLLLVRDTKNPKKDPFHISPVGLAGLQKDFPNRYVEVTEIKVEREVGVVRLPERKEPEVQFKKRRQRKK